MGYALLLFIIIIFVFIISSQTRLSGIKTRQIPSSVPSPSITISRENKTELANPASEYCEQNGGKSKIITASDGSQSGQCIFPDGRQCDEWNLFRTKICK